MPCDTKPFRVGQTLDQRKAEVRDTVARIEKLLARKQVRPVVGPQGAITFAGLTEQDRNGITDACIYRRIMATGSALARMDIAKAEQLAGRGVSRQALAQGVHSHDGGTNWGSH